MGSATTKLLVFRVREALTDIGGKLHRPLLVLALAIGMYAAVPCPRPVDVPAGATLEELSSRYLGSPHYSIAIALATNLRTSDGFHYIANPDDLTGIPRVCIPLKPEARQLQRNWEAYARAVDTARLPRISAISKGLVTIPSDKAVDVATWVRKDQADRLKTASGEWVNTAQSEIWVTVEPYLRDFCRAYVGDRRPVEATLTQRLEQRLGLPPASGKALFVRIRLGHPGPAVIFRPCVDPATDQANCSVGPPAKDPAVYPQWFHGQYYSSYGQSLLGEYPWTALGYTFDWAPGPGNRLTFQRIGESEFVIHKDAPIEILEVVPTAQYCAPPQH